MLWVFDDYKYVYSNNAGIDFRRQSTDTFMTSEVDPCAVKFESATLPYALIILSGHIITLINYTICRY